MAMSAEIKSVSPLGARTGPSCSKWCSGFPALTYPGAQFEAGWRD